MFNNSLKMCFITLLTLGLAFTTACGDDEPAANNKNNNNNTEKDTGTPDKDTGTPDKDTGTPDKDTGTPTPSNKTECETANPPARCAASPEGFEFGLASKLTELKIVGDGTCCFDFGGLNDDDLDNALGKLLSTSLGEGAPAPIIAVNETIAENIADKSLTLILEHDGLAALTGGDFTINFFLGQYDGAKLLIDPVSIDQGTHPLAYLPGAKLADGKVTAGPGNVILNLELFGASLELSIREAKITADVDTANTSLETGVTLIDGKLGGLIVVNEVYDAVNKVAANCECMGLKGAKLVDYSSGSAECFAALGDSNTCDPNKEEESTCATLAENCGLLTVAEALADQDYDGNELSALSVGATFKAEAVKIEGIAAE